MPEKITPEMTIEEVLTRWPSTAKVFVKWGLKAMVCGEPAWGTIKELAERSGVSDIEGLCRELSEEAEGPQVFLK
jgi:hypothetical protein